MLDWFYFWNLIWSFFLLLSLVFIPVFMVLIFALTRDAKQHPAAHGTTEARRPDTGTAGLGSLRREPR